MEHASVILDEMMKQAFGDSNCAEEKRTILALLRLRPAAEILWDKVWGMIDDNYNEDTYNRLYDDFNEFLRKNYERPLGRLYAFLDNNSYSKDKINTMPLSQKEERLYAVLPANKKVLFVLSFFAYEPSITLSFFLKNDFSYRDKNRKQVLHNFKSLNLQNQDKVLSYINKLLEEQNKTDNLIRR